LLGARWAQRGARPIWPANEYGVPARVIAVIDAPRGRAHATT
jgi:hypothetical protein